VAWSAGISGGFGSIILMAKLFLEVNARDCGLLILLLSSDARVLRSRVGSDRRRGGVVSKLGTGLQEKPAGLNCRSGGEKFLCGLAIWALFFAVGMLALSLARPPDPSVAWPITRGLVDISCPARGARVRPLCGYVSSDLCQRPVASERRVLVLSSTRVHVLSCAWHDTLHSSGFPAPPRFLRNYCVRGELRSWLGRPLARALVPSPSFHTPITEYT
jgi:hypothetical protein